MIEERRSEGEEPRCLTDDNVCLPIYFYIFLLESLVDTSPQSATRLSRKQTVDRFIKDKSRFFLEKEISIYKENAYLKDRKSFSYLIILLSNVIIMSGRRDDLMKAFV